MKKLKKIEDVGRTALWVSIPTHGKWGIFKATLKARMRDRRGKNISDDQLINALLNVPLVDIEKHL